jgi:hypothetical protein
MHESDCQRTLVDRHEEMLDGKRLGFFIGDGMSDLLRRYDCQIGPEGWLWIRHGIMCPVGYGCVARQQSESDVMLLSKDDG